MKILFTGGGTMGHVAPALAMAQALLVASKKNECIFVGRSGGRENDAILRRGYPLHTIEVSGILGKSPKEILCALGQMRTARRTARALLEEIAPDAVVGTGGYVCYPVVAEAAKMKLPTLVHESNATPGLTTRILSRRVDAVMLGIPRGEGAFGGAKAVYTGTPVCREFYGGAKEAAKRRLGLSKQRIVVSFGGSLGAESINQLFLTLHEKACTGKTVWIHATGTRYYEQVCEALKGEKNRGRYRLLPFIDDMPTYLCAADAVISRAGACTVAEHEAVGIVPLLIPSPNVTGNHQYHNAKRLSDVGRAVLLEESQLSTPEGEARILEYLKSNNVRKRSEVQAEWAAQRALKVIREVVENRRR